LEVEGHVIRGRRKWQNIEKVGPAVSLVKVRRVTKTSVVVGVGR